jgi:outer membrane protein assembly factor BamB
MTRACRPLTAWRRLAAPLAAAALLAPGPAAADTCSGLGFGAPVVATVSPGSTPVAVATGDFDRDGRMDVVTANYGSGNVSVLRGNVAGGFVSGGTHATGPNPVDVAAADVDGDGILDLVVARGGVAAVALLRGLAGGGFETVTTAFGVGVEPRRVYLADLSRDGRPDLVVVSETGNRLRVFRATVSFGFEPTPSADLALDAPVAAAIADFDRDGTLDVAVALRNLWRVRVFTGDGAGGLDDVPVAELTTGTLPLDVAGGDLDRDGRTDLVTANSIGTGSVFTGNGDGTFTPRGDVSVGTQLERVALADLDRDGRLDVVFLDLVNPPRLVALRGRGTVPDVFEATPYPVALPAASGPYGLAVADLVQDGRPDLVTALSATAQAALVRNESGPTCPRTSWAGAPRAWAAGDGPVSTAAADFDGDGRVDLAVASENDPRVHVLLRGPAGFAPASSVPLSPAPHSVAAADFDRDGRADVVAALGDGTTGRLQVLLGDGAGGLATGATAAVGIDMSAVVVADFDGDGVPDVAAVSESGGALYVFRGDGLGNLVALGAQPVLGGLAGPRALVAADLDGSGRPDLAVAESGGSGVRVLRNDGAGTFTEVAPLATGSLPWGIAAGDVDGDGKLDLVTANNGSDTVSIFRGDGSGGFLAPQTAAIGAGSKPSAVAILDVAGGALPDVLVATLDPPGLRLLVDGSVGVTSGPALLGSPRAITLLDADSDGRLDLAVPCRAADAVVVLLARATGLAEAPRVAVGSQPRAAVVADLDRDGAPDLAVANEGSGTVSLLRSDGAGGLVVYASPGVGDGPIALVAGDFDRDGRVDLAVSTPGGSTPGVSILLAAGPEGQFAAPLLVQTGAGTQPDDLVAGDFDRDGDLDLAVCDRNMDLVRILRNDGAGGFEALGTVAVGAKPTAIVAFDLDRDGLVDLAVANDESDDVSILRGFGDGSFAPQTTLPLAAGGGKPVSLAAADLDGDGWVDLVAAAFGDDRLHVFRNVGGTLQPPTTLPAPNLLAAVAAADLTLDGRLDLAAVAGGLTVFPGTGSFGFGPPQSVVAGATPVALAIGDFDGDGRPDVVVVNDSDDVSLLRSTACAPRRLEVSLQPAGCGTGLPPYTREVVVDVVDDGGNLASCSSGSVAASIAPGTGAPGATLGGPPSLPVTDGKASFTGANALSVDLPGRRYRLALELPGLPPALTRRFTLGAELAIVGPASFCQGTPTAYATEGSYDSYAWTLSPPVGPPFAYTPSVLLDPPAGGYTLGVSTRVDGCLASVSRPVYVGDLQSTTLSIQGASSVCQSCIGGTVTPTDLGGGAVLSRQWGYRSDPGVDPVVPMPGETGETYVLKGSSFPAPGTYHVVVTTTATCGGPLVSGEIPVTVLAYTTGDEIRSLTASARGSASSGEVELRWVHGTSPDELLVRWNKAADDTSLCVPPPDRVSPATGEQGLPGTTETRGSFPHPGLVLDTAYCYTVFARVGAAWSTGRTVKARPFDAVSGPVKWAYSTGATAVVPPVVGGPAILAMSNDRTVHALTRGGASGGYWPADWVPESLTGLAHNRSPVVPFASGATVFPDSSVLFAADDMGDVHAIDARTGQLRWRVTPSANATMTGAPGAILQQYGGAADLVLVPSRNENVTSSSDLFGLSLANGNTLAAYNAAGTLGPMSGSPAVDYANQRVYVAARRLNVGPTLVGVNVGAGPTLSTAWSRYYGEFETSPVLRGGRVYVGNDAGEVVSVDSATGDDLRTFATGDGPVNRFVFPDRRNSDLFFATDTKVWSLADEGGPLVERWQWTEPGGNPSTVLLWPQSDLLYVGGANGTLYELQFVPGAPTPPTAKSLVLGDGTGRVGAPSLDIGVEPPDVTPGRKLLVVGSEAGVLYGVEVPLP